MKSLTLTFLIFVALATVSQGAPPPTAVTGEAAVTATDATASCDGCCPDGHKWHLFHHHSWNLFGHSSHSDGGFCAKFNSKLSSLFNSGPPAPAGQPAFPTHPYARGPRDFFMYD
ncbi:MAG TPA: hypothetical protein VGZ25_11645 [Gemmataceae bacterium]|jgi:hypothetical protein|nr:hypothetical protein [Gemmataceae bacterium]